jgi:predicted nucleic acid-binding protein
MDSVTPGTAGGGLLLDTNVLIDVLRGEEVALEWLRGHAAGSAISVITWIEILVGCREQESQPVRTWLEGFRRLDLDQAVASEAVICRQQRGLKVPDAIILATARCHGLILATRNERDFPPENGQVICPYRLAP